jgi:uncharacterized OB-fold protein
MTGYRNHETGQITLTPPQVSAAEFEAVTLSGLGTVYSCTTLPFQIAIIELQEGPRLTARIEGQKVKIGDQVKQIAERNGVQVFSAA